MRRLLFAVTILAACGPTAPPIEQQCEEQGGEWVCEDGPGSPVERCRCDVTQGEPA